LHTFGIAPKARYTLVAYYTPRLYRARHTTTNEE
jgi:hypothetical protein